MVCLDKWLGFAGQDGLVDFEAVSLTLVIVVELLLDGINSEVGKMLQTAIRFV